MKFKYKPVVIVWDDAMSDSSWTEHPEKLLKPTHALTIGFLVAESSEYYVVADSYITENSDKEISCLTKIPKGWVQSFDFINISKKRKESV